MKLLVESIGFLSNPPQIFNKKNQRISSPPLKCIQWKFQSVWDFFFWKETIHGKISMKITFHVYLHFLIKKNISWLFLTTHISAYSNNIKPFRIFIHTETVLPKDVGTKC